MTDARLEVDERRGVHEAFKDDHGGVENGVVVFEDLNEFPGFGGVEFDDGGLGAVGLAVGVEGWVGEVGDLVLDVVDLVHAVVDAVDGGHALRDVAGDGHSAFVGGGTDGFDDLRLDGAVELDLACSGGLVAFYLSYGLFGRVSEYGSERDEA